MAGKRAPKLFQVRYCRALEQGRGSQYSPRPPESGEKKSPDLKTDQKANLSRPLESTKAYRFRTEFTLDRLYSYSRAGVFAFFFRLGSALAISNKADRSDDFSATERCHTRAPALKKKRGTTYFLGATE
ncbi:hypothetical protein [Pseudomonas chlororaphis]|uniref:hypothetical protein n=1 Tax=Pseudomonas chlororaphis TaxID=587753 RepID=UPI000F5672C7|nr:hypothetical protein [Pseudomonas chlororaphis]